MTTMTDKGYIGLGMEGRIATWYAANTARDMAAFRDLAGRLARDIPPGSRILEVAPGPGYLSIELAKRGAYAITGIDISHTFVAMAAHRARAEQVAVDFQHGNAAAMPFADGSFETIVCRAAFKNFSQPVAALDEMHRVLKPGGRALIIDLRKDAARADIDAYVRSLGLGWWDSLLTRLIFRHLLIPRAYSQQQFHDLAARSRFGAAAITAAGIGLDIILEKPKEQP